MFLFNKVEWLEWLLHLAIKEIIMNATLYDNTSRKNVIHKSLTQIGNTLSVLLKDDTEIVRPTIILTMDADSLKYNYVYLEDLRRYYFVTGKVISNRRIFVQLEVDPLMSFANEIMLCDCILDRHSKIYNKYLHDDLLPKLDYRNVCTIPCSNKNVIQTNNKLNNSYILITTGGYNAS